MCDWQKGDGWEVQRWSVVSASVASDCTREPVRACEHAAQALYLRTVIRFCFTEQRPELLLTYSPRRFAYLLAFHTQTKVWAVCDELHFPFRHFSSTGRTSACLNHRWVVHNPYVPLCWWLWLCAHECVPVIFLCVVQYVSRYLGASELHQLRFHRSWTTEAHSCRSLWLALCAAGFLLSPRTEHHPVRGCETMDR